MFDHGGVADVPKDSLANGFFLLAGRTSLWKFNSEFTYSWENEADFDEQRASDLSSWSVIPHFSLLKSRKVI